MDNQDHWYNDPRAIEKMMKNNDGVVVKDHSQMFSVGGQNNCCSSCHLPFDKGKRRPVMDHCGHRRCNICVVKNADCYMCEQLPIPPLANHSKITDINQTLQSSPSRPRMKTNGHFTTFMQTRSSTFSGDKAIPEPEYEKIRPRRPTTVNVDSHSALSENNAKPNSKNRDPSNNDLYMRLGLLLGDNPGLKGSTAMTTSHLDTGKRSSHSHGSYASISSLASSDANVPAASNNTSPVSTLTGSEADPISESSCSTSSNLGSGLIKGCKEQSLDSVASFTSAGTTGSRSIASSSSSGGLANGRRVFRRQDFSRLSDRCAPLGKRTAFIRRSDRTSNAGAANSQATNKGRIYALRAAQIPFKPIFFEVPQTETEPVFLGRHWLYQKIHKVTI